MEAASLSRDRNSFVSDPVVAFPSVTVSRYGKMMMSIMNTSMGVSWVQKECSGYPFPSPRGSLCDMWY